METICDKNNAQTIKNYIIQKRNALGITLQIGNHGGGFTGGINVGVHDPKIQLLYTLYSCI